VHFVCVCVCVCVGGWRGLDLGKALPTIRNCEEIAIHRIDKALLVALRIDHGRILSLASKDSRSFYNGFHSFIQRKGSNVIYQKERQIIPDIERDKMRQTYDAKYQDAIFLVQAHQKWIVHDEVFFQEGRISLDGIPQDSFAMGQHIQRLWPGHCNKVILYLNNLLVFVWKTDLLWTRFF